MPDFSEYRAFGTLGRPRQKGAITHHNQNSLVDKSECYLRSSNKRFHPKAEIQGSTDDE